MSQHDPKIKVAFVGQFYPVFMGRYLLEALLRRKDVEVWTAGTFTGQSIPWKGGMRVPQEYVFTPDKPFPGNIQVMSYETLKPPWKPDLWLEVNSTLKIIGRPEGKYVVVGTDPHVIDYTLSRANADIFYCMQTPYSQAGDKWLPYGYDPIWHRPSPIRWAEREFDCSLCGLLYGDRVTFFNHLKMRGYKTYADTGKAYEDALAQYNNSRIGFNWSSKLDTTARVFELMAMGMPSIMNHVPDLGKLFRAGEHYLSFVDMQGALSVFETLIHNEAMALKMGLAAREAVAPHSWDTRIAQILYEAGIVDEEPEWTP